MCTAASAPPPLSSYACISCLVCCLRAFFRARSPPRAPPLLLLLLLRLLLLHVPPIFPVCPVFCGDCIASVSCLLFPGLLIIKEGFSGPNNSNAPIIIINNNNNNYKKQSKQRYRMSPFLHQTTFTLCVSVAEPATPLSVACVSAIDHHHHPLHAALYRSSWCDRPLFILLLFYCSVCVLYMYAYLQHIPNHQTHSPQSPTFRSSDWTAVENVSE